MNLAEISNKLGLTLLTDSTDLSLIEPSSGYASDMLSCVLFGAQQKAILVTLLAHINVVGVAAQMDLAAVIITENAQPEPATIARANEKGVPLFSTDASNFEIAGRLWELGLRSG
jgi:hypothetical protein